MTILKTPKQKENEAKQHIAVATFQEVKRTCVGSLRQMCIETQRRLAEQGIKMHEVTIYKLVKQ